MSELVVQEPFAGVTESLRDSHIAFLVSGDAYYKSSIRPSAEIARGCRSLGGKVSVIGAGIVDRSRSELSAIFDDDFVEAEGESRSTVGRFVSDFLKSRGVTHLFVDDANHWAPILAKVRRETHVKLLIYGLVYRGLRLLRFPPASPIATPLQSLLYSSGSLLPFGVLTQSYRRRILESDAFIAISRYTEMLVWTLYGIRSSQVIYPPVSDALRSGPAEASVDRAGILVFVGNSNDRDPKEYVDTLRCLKEMGLALFLIGDSDVSARIQDMVGASSAVKLDRLPDQELGKVFRSVRCTYITTLWEGFGYVGPESLLNGTPVVTEISQPWMELLDSDRMVRVARSKPEIAECVARFSDTTPRLNESVSGRLRNQLSPESAAKSLYSALP
jgi:hypothetical protein